MSYQPPPVNYKARFPEAHNPGIGVLGEQRVPIKGGLS